MIDDVSFLESYIKQLIPTITVFQNTTDEAEVELDVQNEPGRPLSFIRVLLTRENAAALRRDHDLASRVVATLRGALEGPSDEPEAVLDLRQAL
ncbi:MAG: hypothetical protein JOZ39_02370 [Chloroflexi bacterium]|nr:hypothetical protein [Chloroflexota bacterium]